MNLPTLTHLQFLVMSKLFDGEMAGRELRERLRKDGQRHSGPAFYQMMARLEDAKFVDGWYDEKVIDGQMIRERRYKLTGKGHRAYSKTHVFYAQNCPAGSKGGLGYAT